MEDEAEEDDDDMAMSDDGSSDNDSVGTYHGNINKCLFNYIRFSFCWHLN